MKDKKLFKSTSGSLITATLMHGRHYGLHTIVYKRAADLLVQHIIETKITLDINTLVFPILYLYRHYIEIKLKDIIRTGYQAF